MKNSVDYPNLSIHFDGVKPEDLLVLAFHNGVAYSVHQSQADFHDLDNELVLALKRQVAHGEFVSRLSRTARNA